MGAFSVMGGWGCWAAGGMSWNKLLLDKQLGPLQQREVKNL